MYFLTCVRYQVHRCSGLTLKEHDLLATLQNGALSVEAAWHIEPIASVFPIIIFEFLNRETALIRPNQTRPYLDNLVSPFSIGLCFVWYSCSVLRCYLHLRWLCYIFNKVLDITV